MSVYTTVSYRINYQNQVNICEQYGERKQISSNKLEPNWIRCNSWFACVLLHETGNVYTGHDSEVRCKVWANKGEGLRWTSQEV